MACAGILWKGAASVRTSYEAACDAVAQFVAATVMRPGRRIISKEYYVAIPGSEGQSQRNTDPGQVKRQTRRHRSYPAHGQRQVSLRGRREIVRSRGHLRNVPSR